MCPCSRYLPRVSLLFLIVMVGCVGGAVSPGAPSQAAAGEEDVLALIDGTPIRIADLPDEISNQLATLEYQFASQRYRVLQAGLDESVRQRLIEDAAVAEGATADEFVQARLEELGEVSDADVEAWYAANQGRLQGRDRETLSPAIRQFLGEQQQEELLTELTEKLMSEREVAVRLQPFRAQLVTDGYPTHGPDRAAITLVEFSDFECPYCRGFWETLERVKLEYEGRVRLVYRQFPLRQIHPNAQKSAEASLCAAEQGQFWELHDLMFEEQSSLTVDDLKDKATRLGLDAPGFAACLDSGKNYDRVESDLQAGARLGITGTPALFVNGRPVDGGAVPFEAIAEIIDDELERVGR